MPGTRPGMTRWERVKPQASVSKYDPARRIAPIIVGVLARLFPVRVAVPGEMAREHVVAVPHAEQQRALRTVGVFVHFAGRMDHERSGRDLDGALWRAHGPTAGKAEINLCRVRVAVIGADLPGFPTRHGDVPAADLAEDFFDMLARIELLLVLQAEDMHQAPRPL